MNIIDEREENNNTFGELKAGAVFLCPDYYDETSVFMKMGRDYSDIVSEKGWNFAEGWIGVDLYNGDFSVFSNNTRVIEVKANLTIR